MFVFVFIVLLVVLIVNYVFINYLGENSGNFDSVVCMVVVFSFDCLSVWLFECGSDMLLSEVFKCCMLSCVGDMLVFYDEDVVMLYEVKIVSIGKDWVMLVVFVFVGFDVVYVICINCY